MKSLSLEKMENIEGGGFWGCLSLGLGLIGFAAAIISVPVTGPVGLSAAVGLFTTTIGSGIAAADCSGDI